MLQTVTIQNFKSLRDVTVRLQKVNLLIGPNNSGKSNFLKALSFLKEHYAYRIQPSIINLGRLYYGQNSNTTGLLPRNSPILFSFQWQLNHARVKRVLYQLELYGYKGDRNSELVYCEGIGSSSTKNPSEEFRLQQLSKIIDGFSKFFVIYENKAPNTKNIREAKLLEMFEADDVPKEIYLNVGQNISLVNRRFPTGGFLNEHTESFSAYTPEDILETFGLIKIYKPEPSKIAKESLLLFDKHVNEDCSNLVAFLDNMRDEHPNVWKAIERDLNKCIPDFEGINFGKVTIKSNLNTEGRTESIGKRFGLRDKHGKTYWADELSEGTIYFLALLAIVHQPNPPKVLLLEEPEKGIHPRRIAEVMDLIFRLAEEKDIQIILTSHSTQVVDAFQDIPESVFVFDMVDGETKIKNLQTDILESDAKDAQQKNFPKIDYSKRSLGEHWAIGLLGGVPV